MLTALMHVRNEQWILGASLRAALHLVDQVVVLDHGSDDSTPDIINEVAVEATGRVHRLGWASRHYHETELRQRTLEHGREVGGTHFFWLDADEILTGNQVAQVRDAVLRLRPRESMELPWLAMWGSTDRYRDDTSVWSNNFKTFAFGDDLAVGYRADRDGYDMHRQTPRGLRGPAQRPIGMQRAGGVMHLQFAHRRRLLAKHAWYKMSEAIRFPGRERAQDIDQRYNAALCTRDLVLANAPASWWAPYAGLLERCDLTDAPWHEVEVLRFWREHGPETFEGLDLWGLPQRLEQEAAA